MKLDSFPKCDFIPVDYPEVRHAKAAFKKLLRACCPSAPPTPEHPFLKAVEESGWLPLIQQILQLAGMSFAFFLFSDFSFLLLGQGFLICRPKSSSLPFRSEVAKIGMGDGVHISILQ